MNKKAIELSINFIVLTILSLLVLGVGFYIVTNIFTLSTEYKEDLDEQTQENILEALRQSGELISLPITSYTIERGDHTLIGVGVLNSVGNTQIFYISMTCTEAIDTDDNELCAQNSGVSCDTEAAAYCSQWVTLGDEKITLENRKSQAIGTYISVPSSAPAGIFGFSFKVCTGNYCGLSSSTQYGPTKKLYITVPE